MLVFADEVKHVDKDPPIYVYATFWDFILIVTHIVKELY